MIMNSNSNCIRNLPITKVALIGAIWSLSFFFINSLEYNFVCESENPVSEGVAAHLHTTSGFGRGGGVLR